MSADDVSRQAHEIHFSSTVIDAHVDTPQRILFDQFDLGQRDSQGCVDIPRMREGGVRAIVFALWVPVAITGAEATRRVFDLLAAVEQQVAVHSDDLTLARSAEEVRTAHQQGKMAILLAVEGGHAIDDDRGVLREFAARGVRYMTLTHNAATGWADSSNDARRHGGLTEFGKEAIREMNRLGMMVDVSHVSDETFRHVIEVSQAPVIASHSNCRAICDVPRNMTDEMIRTLAERGGVVHINFHDAFLSQEYAAASKSLHSNRAAREKDVQQGFGENEARKLMAGQEFSDEMIRAGKLPQVSWEKIVEHIDHAVRLVGVDHVGLGSDFDGAFMPDGMRDASNLPAITQALFERGYGESDVRGILGENTLRVIAECEQVGERLRSGNF